MTWFRVSVIAVLIALSGSIQAADSPADPDKLRGEVAKLTNANAELTRQVKQLTRLQEECQHVLDQIQRANKDD